MVLNSLSVCLSVKLLISLSNLNESLAGSSILGCRFFPFIAKYIVLFLSGLQGCAENSADNHMGIPLYVICCFFFIAFNIFSVFNFHQFD